MKQESTSPSNTLPLSLTPQGETVLIEQIRGGKKMRQRLMDLGLNQGARIRIIKNEMPGPLIIAVKKDGRLALGRGMSQKIMVTLVREDNPSGEK
ncbi:MAG: hypothetical protein CSA11_11480 [Chloroflexi bacterium]|nr:MAG: hypothetical protein CSB13_04975 [Chloroflexota bacterium]PIE79634.1 MAG: hypothetical protein CSA11_11480 [Chloroflexota bacterium]